MGRTCVVWVLGSNTDQRNLSEVEGHLLTLAGAALDEADLREPDPDASPSLALLCDMLSCVEGSAVSALICDSPGSMSISSFFAIFIMRS
jgi:hypothetical protein